MMKPAIPHRFSAAVIALSIAVLTNACGSFFAPPRPENLSATPISPHEIVLFWDIYLYGEDSLYDVGFNIYRDGKYINNVWWDLSYEDSVLLPATRYCYSVSSFYIDDLVDIFLTRANESKKSETVCVETFPLSAISGIVTSEGSGLTGVTIYLIAVFPYGGSYTSITGPGGEYLFTDLENGLYLVAPSYAGYTFIPETREVTIHNGNAAGLDFESAGGALPQSQ